MEWARFDYYCSGLSRCPSVTAGTNDYYLPTFLNGASMGVSCYTSYDTSLATTTCSNESTTAVIATGIANSSERAFFLGISNSTTTYP
jgi:uncharacterized membrane protein